MSETRIPQLGILGKRIAAKALYCKKINLLIGRKWSVSLFSPKLGLRAWASPAGAKKVAYALATDIILILHAKVAGEP